MRDEHGVEDKEEAMNETAQDIVSDAEIERVHANANFGTQTKRGVVNDGVLKYAFGYEGGSTQIAILVEHGLIKKPKIMSSRSTLTQKGVRYLRAVFWAKVSESTHLADAIHPGPGHVMIRHDDGCSIAGKRTDIGFLICCECGAPAYGNGHVVRKTHEVLEDVAANMEAEAVTWENNANSGRMEDWVPAMCRANTFRRCAAMVRPAAASSPTHDTTCSVPGGHRYGPDGRCVWCDAEGPAPAKDPWVPVAEAPEEWRDGREILCFADGERVIARFMTSTEDGSQEWIVYQQLGEDALAVRFSDPTYLMLPPDPPKGD
jgi:hypothetical protein